MTVNLWAARLNRPLAEGEVELLSLLPPERRERLVRLPAEKRREPLCAWLLLRLALRESFGWTELPPVALTDRGKPFFSDYPQVHFNLSHTEGAVLAGLSDKPIGVDIERIRPVAPRLMAQVGASTDEDFFAAWVRREARTKCSGRGIGAMLRQEPPMEPGELCRELEIFPGYAACAASRGGTLPETVRICSMEELL
ncbi:4'-phosphopantetheinyl transferase family protein [Dysosmobacter sp.]|uniref:4'-phosphopantetheinyl transferase family protein n=1 Tax=Dysosmobacter sp. TaxID=2591382 RepID=UPI002A9E1FEA|nr:4'-phosphopantetheinyl transferase [Dysosmobacter sp.]MDY5611615.1 4'-phosphopantetheinyl transferase [Dysosmobacter sp.]